MFCFIRSKAYKRFFRREFDVYAYSVRKKAEPVCKNGVRSGNGFCVDISCKSVFFTKKAKSFYHMFHGPIRRSHNSGRKKKPFNIVPAVKFDSKFRNFSWGESCPGKIVASSADAVFTVINTVIGVKNL